MNATRENDRLRLTYNSIESRVLRHIFEIVIANYKVPPEQMDPKTAAVWYSTRGCESVQMSAEETRDWLHQLHGFKSANLVLLEEWVDQLARRKEGQHELRLKLEQAASLLTVLNDHRLLAAARNDIGQAEMDLPTHEAFQKLTQPQQLALFEIHLLAWMIEEILRLTAPEAANWLT
jgi:hypothetical protein